MKDRFVLIGGALALLVAVASSVWLLGSRSPAAAVQTDSPTIPAMTPIAVAAATPRATAASATTVDLVIALDGLGGAGAFAAPGDHVDVLAFIPGELNQGNAMTRVLLPDVVVLQGAAASDSSLIVGVSPEQAVLARSAQSLGLRMFVEMRSADTSIAAQTTESVSELDIRSRLRTKS